MLLLFRSADNSKNLVNMFRLARTGYSLVEYGHFRWSAHSWFFLLILFSKTPDSSML